MTAEADDEDVILRTQVRFQMRSARRACGRSTAAASGEGDDLVFPVPGVRRRFAAEGRAHANSMSWMRLLERHLALRRRSLLRGMLSSSARTWPGWGLRRRMRLPTLMASLMLWVTKRTMKRVSSQRRSSSSCMVRRVRASRAAKGSSMSRISGSIAMPRAMATRCFMPPAEGVGVGVGEAGQAHLLDIGVGAVPGLAAREAAGGEEGEHDVVADGFPREELVELLEHHHAVGSRVP